MSRVMRARFAKFGPTKPMVGLTIRQKQGNHTLGLLDYEFTKHVRYVLPEPGTPVSVLWGVPPLGVRTFYGYVNHYETVSAQGISSTRLVALGTSKPMNSVIPTNWSDTTRSAVARAIAKRHRLRSIIHPHNFSVPSWSTGPNSDLAALRRLADETGYLVWVDGSTLLFLDPQRVLSSAQSRNTPNFVGKDLREAKVTAGSEAPRESGQTRRRITYGLDETTNDMFEVRSGSLDDPVQIVDKTVLTFGEAYSLGIAADRKNQDYYTVKAEVSGDSGVVPGSLASLGGRNADQRGTWLVQEVEHMLTGRDFTSTFVGVRNQSRIPTIQSRETLRDVNEFTGAIIRDGKIWEASSQDHVNV